MSCSSCCPCEYPLHSRRDHGETCLRCGLRRPPRGPIHWIRDEEGDFRVEALLRAAGIESDPGAERVTYEPTKDHDPRPLDRDAFDEHLSRVGMHLSGRSERALAAHDEDMRRLLARVARVLRSQLRVRSSMELEADLAPTFRERTAETCNLIATIEELT